MKTPNTDQLVELYHKALKLQNDDMASVIVAAMKTSAKAEAMAAESRHLAMLGESM